MVNAVLHPWLTQPEHLLTRWVLCAAPVFEGHSVWPPGHQQPYQRRQHDGTQAGSNLSPWSCTLYHYTDLIIVMIYDPPVTLWRLEGSLQSSVFSFNHRNIIAYIKNFPLSLRGRQCSREGTRRKESDIWKDWSDLTLFHRIMSPFVLSPSHWLSFKRTNVYVYVMSDDRLCSKPNPGSTMAGNGH